MFIQQENNLRFSKQSEKVKKSAFTTQKQIFRLFTIS